MSLPNGAVPSPSPRPTSCQFFLHSFLPAEQHLHSSIAQSQGFAVIFKPSLPFMPKSIPLGNPAKAIITILSRIPLFLINFIVTTLVHAGIIFLVALCHFPWAALS